MRGSSFSTSSVEKQEQVVSVSYSQGGRVNLNNRVDSSGQGLALPGYPPPHNSLKTRKIIIRVCTIILILVGCTLSSFGIASVIKEPPGGSAAGLVTTTAKPKPAPTTTQPPPCTANSTNCAKPKSESISQGTVLQGGGSTTSREDPCQDFYSYACAEWLEENPKPQEHLIYSTFVAAQESVDRVLQGFLTSPGGQDAHETSSPHIRNAKSFYKSCMEFKNTAATFRAELDQFLQSHPEVENSRAWGGRDPTSSEFDLTDRIGEFLLLNAAPLFDLNLMVDPHNSGRYTLLVDLPVKTTLFTREARDFGMVRFDSMNLPNELANQTFTPAVFTSTNTGDVDRHFIYEEIMKTVRLRRLEALIRIYLTVYGVNRNAKETADDIDQITQFIGQLDLLVPKPKSQKMWTMQNRIYNDFTVESMQEHFGLIQWQKLLQKLVGTKRTAQHFPWKTVKVYVAFPKHLKSLLELLTNANPRIVEMVMVCTYLRDVRELTLYAGESGAEESLRRPFCIEATKSEFPHELSLLYLNSFPQPRLDLIRAETQVLFRDIKATLISLLTSSNWITKSAKQEAVRKIQELKGKFVGPSTNTIFLNGSLGGNIQMSSTDFYANVRTLYAHSRKEVYRYYWLPVDEEAIWTTGFCSPFMVTGAYSANFNMIVIPLAGLLPMNENGGDRAALINAAITTFIIGHEAAHAVGTGRSFDSKGRYRNWWNEESLRNLQSKMSCVDKQYSQTFFPRRVTLMGQGAFHILIDPALTSNENMADILGIQLAFKVWQNTSKFQPGLTSRNFTKSQMFYYSFAQMFCTHVKPQALIFLLELDVHSPYLERTNGMLMNHEFFSTAFNCSAGVRMNPVQKCGFS